MKRIILASQSKPRKELMKQLGIPFEVVVSDYEEDHSLSNNPYELVKLLALGKAKDVAKKVKNAIIIGADSMVLFNDRLIGKPKNKEEAYDMIKELCGNTHILITGLAVIDTEKNIEETVHCESKITFRKLTEEEINSYLNSFDCTKFAGAYAIEHKAMLFTEKIEGSYTNVVGLPMEKLAVILKKLGVNVFEKE